MARQHIYTVLSKPNDPNRWAVVKMDRDYDVVQTYEVSEVLITLSENVHMFCDCYASNKETCRHRQLVTLFRKANAVDSRRAYDFDKQKWIEPLKHATLELY